MARCALRFIGGFWRQAGPMQLLGIHPQGIGNDSVTQSPKPLQPLQPLLGTTFLARSSLDMACRYQSEKLLRHQVENQGLQGLGLWRLEAPQ